ncbi:hypothetical protein C4D60_Mb02t19720 [Musa balbisiana]|uniref:Histone H2A/H2B/H3 domain-containing protein n=1 Tax=Musa balbisiana TaxID=52838 RepID=A0A4S8IEA6_MUSBA|nr:hypothetical protein C4D60_Mb02t19720 [Musa balbisiana]
MAPRAEKKPAEKKPAVAEEKEKRAEKQPKAGKHLPSKDGAAIDKKKKKAKKGNETYKIYIFKTSVRLVLPGELAKHAVSEGTKAVTKFTKYDESVRHDNTKQFRNE